MSAAADDSKNVVSAEASEAAEYSAFDENPDVAEASDAEAAEYSACDETAEASEDEMITSGTKSSSTPDCDE